MIILTVTVLLVWFSLNSLPVSEGTDKWTYLWNTWQNADKRWLIAMAVIIMASHLVRAERWRMLIHPSGYQVTTGRSLLSLMIGYLVNLVIPRGGEISRCYNLYKLDKVPVETSFGTVVVERVVDVICLLTLIGLSFVMESEKLFGFINTLPIGAGGSKINAMIYLALVCVLMAMLFFILYKRNQRVKTFVTKTWLGFRDGLTSVFRMEKKGLFVFYSVLIWVLYFLSSYAVVQAFEETQHLGLNAILSLFTIGSLAMAAPLPGGTGSYHVLVPQGLVFLYGIPRANAVAFVFIFHGWQTFLIIAGGAISLIVTSILVKRKSVAESSI
jgi:glycosyltransferase 2 family protein